VLSEDYQYCRYCGGYIPLGSLKFCDDECREAWQRISRSKPEARHASLVRILERERVPQTDLLYHFEFYAALIQDNCCTYCDGPLSPSSHALDRKINAEGHRCFNVVPSCGRCNSIKGDDEILTYEEMLLLKPILIEIRERRELLKPKKK
jgi:5-methylcytosine-specific restriction endonuclease McrA